MELVHITKKEANIIKGDNISYDITNSEEIATFYYLTDAIEYFKNHKYFKVESVTNTLKHIEYLELSFENSKTTSIELDKIFKNN